jgi:hypothetical protein
LLQAIKQTASTLEAAALPRKREELLKFLKTSDPSLPFLDCYDHNILEHISPTLFKLFQNPEQFNEFFQQLRQFHDYQIDQSKPLNVMVLFVYMYVSVIYNDEELHSLNTSQLHDNKELTQFFRFEIGIFKLELEIAYKVITSIKKLKPINKYKGEGDNKVFDIVKRDSFYLAFMIGQHEKHLSPDVSSFWLEKYTEHLNEIIEYDKSRVKTRIKRRVRRKR